MARATPYIQELTDAIKEQHPDADGLKVLVLVRDALGERAQELETAVFNARQLLHALNPDLALEVLESVLRKEGTPQ